MIELKNIYYSYHTVSDRIPALIGINAVIPNDRITAIVGKTGSGKSTLTEIIGGITEPDSGTVLINGCAPKNHRDKIGLVFQYPEYQLFAETVYDDIAYGPSLSGINGIELDNIVKDAAELVGLAPELLRLSPFELSGGQKRMAALAGILSLKPSLLLLDEPAAGLDPQNKKRIFASIRSLAENDNVTVIFVTHSMDDAAEYADELLVMHEGRVRAHGTPDDIFTRAELLAQCSLDIPQSIKLKKELEYLGLKTGKMLTRKDVFRSICDVFTEHGIYPQTKGTITNAP